MKRPQNSKQVIRAAEFLVAVHHWQRRHLQPGDVRDCLGVEFLATVVLHHARGKPISMKQLVLVLGASASGMRKLVRRFSASGRVCVSASSHDRRVRLVHPAARLIRDMESFARAFPLSGGGRDGEASRILGG